jgi:hypothetical protein
MEPRGGHMGPSRATCKPARRKVDESITRVNALRTRGAGPPTGRAAAPGRPYTAPMPAPPPRPSTPIEAVLASSEALTRLSDRLRRSNACFESIAPLLPAALRTQVRPGPIDDEGWALLVPHAAAAAKLRQVLPALEAHLRAAGAGPLAIRVRILPGS